MFSQDSRRFGLTVPMEVHRQFRDNLFFWLKSRSILDIKCQRFPNIFSFCINLLSSILASLRNRYQIFVKVQKTTHSPSKMATSSSFVAELVGRNKSVLLYQFEIWLTLNRAVAAKHQPLPTFAESGGMGIDLPHVLICKYLLQPDTHTRLRLNSDLHRPSLPA